MNRWLGKVACFFEIHVWVVLRHACLPGCEQPSAKCARCGEVR